jgi:Fe-S cluster assembly iron-binding protein IscA
MLTLSPAATEAVAAIVGRQSDSASAGLRIGGTTRDYTVAVVTSPEPQDVVVEEGAARVYLDETVAAALDDKMLEAQVDDAGALSFGLAPQS